MTIHFQGRGEVCGNHSRGMPESFLAGLLRLGGVQFCATAGASGFAGPATVGPLKLGGGMV
jgi:hypothetical protein